MGGIYASNSAQKVIIKWTHLDFGGAALKALPFPGTGLKAGTQYVLYFENPTGLFVMEDSWIYGSPDDATRFMAVSITLCVTLWKNAGSTGGDGLNAKGSGCW